MLHLLVFQFSFELDLLLRYLALYGTQPISRRPVGIEVTVELLLKFFD